MSERTLEQIYKEMRQKKIDEAKAGEECKECGKKLDADGDCPECDKDKEKGEGDDKEKKDKPDFLKKDESLQLEAIDPSKLSKIQLIAKLQPMVKFSEKFLKKMDEGTLRTILTAMLTMGLPRIQKDLAGETTDEE